LIYNKRDISITINGYAIDPKKYPIEVKKMTDEETKDYHLKRLADLCLKSKGAKSK